jgi:hypothetical protein
MPISQSDIEDQVQYIKNRSYDTDYKVSAIEILGEDTDTSPNCLRKIQVDSSGNLKIDPTGLDTTYLKLNQTAPQTITIGTPIFDVGLDSNDDIVILSGKKLILDG